MEDKYLFIVRDEDGDPVYCTVPDPDMADMSLEKYARFVKGTVDLSRQLNGEDFTECCEVWVQDLPFRLHLLATFF